MHHERVESPENSGHLYGILILALWATADDYGDASLVVNLGSAYIAGYTSSTNFLTAAG